MDLRLYISLRYLYSKFSPRFCHLLSLFSFFLSFYSLCSLYTYLLTLIIMAHWLFKHFLILHITSKEQRKRASKTIP